MDQFQKPNPAAAQKQRVSGVMPKTLPREAHAVGTLDSPPWSGAGVTFPRQIRLDYIAGSITVSMTWMTPFDWITSAMVIEATLPCSSVSFIMSPS